MTPYHFALPDKHFVTSYVGGRYRANTRRTLNETIRHALRDHNLRYVKKWESIEINNEQDEENLVIFKLKHL